MKPIGAKRQSKWQDVLMPVFGAFLLAEGVFMIYGGCWADWHSCALGILLGAVDILFGVIFFVIGIYGVLPEWRRR